MTTHILAGTPLYDVNTNTNMNGILLLISNFSPLACHSAFQFSHSLWLARFKPSASSKIIKIENPKPTVILFINIENFNLFSGA